MTHLSTEGIEIEVSDMPVRDELAELREFVEKQLDVECEFRITHKKESAENSFGRTSAFTKVRAEIDRLIAKRGK